MSFRTDWMAALDAANREHLDALRSLRTAVGCHRSVPDSEAFGRWVDESLERCERTEARILNARIGSDFPPPASVPTEGVDATLTVQA